MRAYSHTSLYVVTLLVPFAATLFESCKPLVMADHDSSE